MPNNLDTPMRRTCVNAKALPQTTASALFNVIGHGVTRVSDEIRGKKPAAHWTLARFIGLFLSKTRRTNLMRRLTGTERNAEVFRQFNRYLMLRLTRKM